MVEFSYNDYWQDFIQSTSFVLNTSQHPMKPFSGINKFQVLVAKNWPSICLIIFDRPRNI